jgi:hypothetical protein
MGVVAVLLVGIVVGGGMRLEMRAGLGLWVLARLGR